MWTKQVIATPSAATKPHQLFAILFASAILRDLFMSKQLLSKVRPSASLILLAKDNSCAAPNYDYKALLFTRASKSSFMPDSSVFPGGVCDAADSTTAWLSHFERYDVSAAKLRNFLHVPAVRPTIFDPQDGNESVEASLSLRLTAIRETFEEVGILLCRDRKTLMSPCGGYAQFQEQFDRAHWQHVVHNDSSKFLTLCQELDVVPDVWALYEWSVWQTPSTFQRRFMTAFFMAVLQNVPSLHVEPNEAKDAAWRTPLEYLKSVFSEELWLPPPQFYELSRCLNFKSLDALLKFAQTRAAKGLELMHPVIYKCKDGTVQLYTGDEMYPKEPDSSNKPIELPLSMADFRAKATKQLHRSEHTNRYNCIQRINFQMRDGQINPLDASNINQ